LLQEKGIQADVVEYLNNPPNAAELDQILIKLGKEPIDIMRSGEDEFKTHVKGNTLSRHEAIALMVAYPKMIERPIVVNGDKAAIGRPPENVLNIL